MIHNENTEEQRRITGLAIGDYAMFYSKPCSTQIQWGGHDDPIEAGMKIGEIYQVSDIEIHDYYSHIRFNGIVGSFNAISFIMVDPKDKTECIGLREKAIKEQKKNDDDFKKDFLETAESWIVNIQKCGLKRLSSCSRCILWASCQEIKKQLVIMNATLSDFRADC